MAKQISNKIFELISSYKDTSNGLLSKLKDLQLTKDDFTSNENINLIHYLINKASVDSPKSPFKTAEAVKYLLTQAQQLGCLEEFLRSGKKQLFQEIAIQKLNIKATGPKKEAIDTLLNFVALHASKPFKDDITSKYNLTFPKVESGLPHSLTTDLPNLKSLETLSNSHNQVQREIKAIKTVTGELKQAKAGDAADSKPASQDISASELLSHITDANAYFPHLQKLRQTIDVLNIAQQCMKLNARLVQSFLLPLKKAAAPVAPRPESSLMPAQAAAATALPLPPILPPHDHDHKILQETQKNIGTLQSAKEPWANGLHMGPSTVMGRVIDHNKTSKTMGLACTIHDDIIAAPGKAVATVHHDAESRVTKAGEAYRKIVDLPQYKEMGDYLNQYHTTRSALQAAMQNPSSEHHSHAKVMLNLLKADLERKGGGELIKAMDALASATEHREKIQASPLPFIQAEHITILMQLQANSEQGIKEIGTLIDEHKLIIQAITSDLETLQGILRNHGDQRITDITSNKEKDLALIALKHNVDSLATIVNTIPNTWADLNKLAKKFLNINIMPSFGMTPSTTICFLLKFLTSAGQAWAANKYMPLMNTAAGLIDASMLNKGVSLANLVSTIIYAKDIAFTGSLLSYAPAFSLLGTLLKNIAEYCTDNQAYQLKLGIVGEALEHFGSVAIIINSCIAATTATTTLAAIAAASIVTSGIVHLATLFLADENTYFTQYLHSSDQDIPSFTGSKTLDLGITTAAAFILGMKAPYMLGMKAYMLKLTPHADIAKSTLGALEFTLPSFCEWQKLPLGYKIPIALYGFNRAYSFTKDYLYEKNGIIHSFQHAFQMELDTPPGQVVSSIVGFVYNTITSALCFIINNPYMPDMPRDIIHYIGLCHPICSNDSISCDNGDTSSLHNSCHVANTVLEA